MGWRERNGVTSSANVWQRVGENDREGDGGIEDGSKGMEEGDDRMEGHRDREG